VKGLDDIFTGGIGRIVWNLTAQASLANANEERRPSLI
jgi:hypothetical protein